MVGVSLGVMAPDCENGVSLAVMMPEEDARPGSQPAGVVWSLRNELSGSPPSISSSEVGRGESPPDVPEGLFPLGQQGSGQGFVVGLGGLLPMVIRRTLSPGGGPDGGPSGQVVGMYHVD